MKKTTRRLVSFLSVTLCAALIVVSPGPQCYAVAGDTLRDPSGSSRTFRSRFFRRVSEPVGRLGDTLRRLFPNTNLNLPKDDLSLRLRAGGATPGIKIRDGENADLLASTPATAADKLQVSVGGASGDGAIQESDAGNGSRRTILASLSGVINAPGRLRRSLSQIFDRAKPKPEIPAEPTEVVASAPELPDTRIKAYLLHPRQKPVMLGLAELRKHLAKGSYAQDFNQTGHLRVVLGDGKIDGPTLARTDVNSLAQTLQDMGLNIAKSRVRTEVIPFGGKSADASGAKGQTHKTLGLLEILVRSAAVITITTPYVIHYGMWKLGQFIEYSPGLIILMALGFNAYGFVRGLVYAGGMFKAAFKESGRPRWNEIVGGIVGKIVPAFVNIGIFATAYKSHLWAFMLASALSLAVESFHGICVNAWDTFQSKVGRERGAGWQNTFNFIYGQLISGSYRAIAFFALATVAAPWTMSFWGAIIAMVIIGTFCGTLGYRGLNDIYEKGRIPRWGRAGIQQTRDFFMMLVGPFFSTGNILMTVISFGVMQGNDLLIFAIDKMLKTRPIIYLVDERIAESENFRKIFINKPSLVHEATDGITNFILFKPFVAAYRWGRNRIQASKSSSQAAVTQPVDTE